ncbi:hypothetical protein [Amycolatopsis rubida]|uniref:Uncharacterized protein n=1 Tax=Amycolatopsis rubida TaxID=112413 RepID=A0A1I5U4X9_9PSEU|nr:hypothetical protein [Amycolatopsis rubida]SFP90358.1 hypothetical protein SAMN05421854_107402 [Amycolatopsis rubida]
MGNLASGGRWTTVLCPRAAEALGATELADAVFGGGNRELPPPPGSRSFAAEPDLVDLRVVTAEARVEGAVSELAVESAEHGSGSAVLRLGFSGRAPASRPRAAVADCCW